VSEVLVVASKVKDLVRTVAGDDFRTGADFLEELSKAVEELTKAAVGRAKVAGRKTVKSDDL
jgi:histone H3/H4